MSTYPYYPKNIDKYAGDSRRIIARSKWELMYMQALDMSPMVRKWISEPKNLGIHYVNPIDKKMHTYWPDFFVQYTDGNMELLEIKPLKQSVAQEAVNTYDKLMFVKNVSKWNAAYKFARSIGARFRVITEKNLFQRKSTNSANKSRTTQKSRGTVKR